MVLEVRLVGVLYVFLGARKKEVVLDVLGLNSFVVNKPNQTNQNKIERNVKNMVRKGCTLGGSPAEAATARLGDATFWCPNYK